MSSLFQEKCKYYSNVREKIKKSRKAMPEQRENTNDRIRVIAIYIYVYSFKNKPLI